jgi:hypothetical protein
MLMNTSRLLSLLFGLAGAAVLSGTGCVDVGKEGGRCNPLLSHDECGDGLHCTQPVDCPENYCCPVETTPPSTSPYCQPGCNGGLQSICAATNNDAADCPGADGSSSGDDSASDAAASDAAASDAATSDAPASDGGGG